MKKPVKKSAKTSTTTSRQKGAPRERRPSVKTKPGIVLAGFGVRRGRPRQDVVLPDDLASSAIGGKGSDPTCPCGFCTGTNRPLVELDAKVRSTLQASTPDEVHEIADYMLSVGARTLAVITGNDDVQDDVMVPTPAMRRLLEAVDHHATTTQQPFSDVAEHLIGQLRTNVIYN